MSISRRYSLGREGFLPRMGTEEEFRNRVEPLPCAENGGWETGMMGAIGEMLCFQAEPLMGVNTVTTFHA